MCCTSIDKKRSVVGGRGRGAMCSQFHLLFSSHLFSSLRVSLSFFSSFRSSSAVFISIHQTPFCFHPSPSFQQFFSSRPQQMNAPSSSKPTNQMRCYQSIMKIEIVRNKKYLGIGKDKMLARRHHNSSPSLISIALFHIPFVSLKVQFCQEDDDTPNPANFA